MFVNPPIKDLQGRFSTRFGESVCDAGYNDKVMSYECPPQFGCEFEIEHDVPYSLLTVPTLCGFLYLSQSLLYVHRAVRVDIRIRFIDTDVRKNIDPTE